MTYDVPFVPNTKDDLYCLQAAYMMIVKYYKPDILKLIGMNGLRSLVLRLVKEIGQVPVSYGLAIRLRKIF